MHYKGLIFSIERSSTVDGPGIRTVVFLKGCPLRCMWCQNPESLKHLPQITWSYRKCIGCSLCIDACPKKAISVKKTLVITDRSLCTNCGRCALVCPSKARELMGRKMSAGQVLGEVIRDKVFYDVSGGGVTVSGGEPASQPDFVIEFFKKCKAVGIRTALDTSGFAQWEILKKILKYTDLLLYDLKIADPAKHLKYTGVQKDLIWENLKKADAMGKAIWVRTPVVPGINDDEDNIEKIARFMAGLKHVQRYDLLPYHSYAGHKYSMLGLKNKLDKFEPPTEQKMQKLKKIAESKGIKEVVCM